MARQKGLRSLFVVHARRRCASSRISWPPSPAAAVSSQADRREHMCVSRQTRVAQSICYIRTESFSVNDLAKPTLVAVAPFSPRHGRERLLPSAPTSPLMTSSLNICGYISLRAKVVETRPSRHLHCHWPPCQAMESAVQPKITSTSCWPRASSD